MRLVLAGDAQIRQEEEKWERRTVKKGKVGGGEEESWVTDQR